MKKKTILCTMAVTALLLGGCGTADTPENQNVSENNTTQSPQATSAADSTPNASTNTQDMDNTNHDTNTNDANANVNNTTNTDNTDTGINTYGANMHNGNAVSGNTQSEMISEEEAKRIALNHAGITNDQATFVKSGTDRENGRWVYDIEFFAENNKEFDYEIDPYTGNVLDYDYDAEYYPATSDTADTKRIPEDEAKKLILDRIPGATEQDIWEFHTDYEDSKLQYEGKIYYDQKEYEFEIDAHEGTIMEWDEEPIYEEKATR